jgi:hypothetical protein
MESSSIITVATVVLSIVSLFLGAKYRKWLKRLEENFSES